MKYSDVSISMSGCSCVGSFPPAACHHHDLCRALYDFPCGCAVVSLLSQGTSASSLPLPEETWWNFYVSRITEQYSRINIYGCCYTVAYLSQMLPDLSQLLCSERQFKSHFPLFSLLSFGSFLHCVTALWLCRPSVILSVQIAVQVSLLASTV